MRTLLNVVLALGLCAGMSGCASVGSAMGGNNSETGEAWWVKNTGIPPFLTLSSKVFYCPAPANGPAQCKEAKMIEGAPSAK